MKPGATRRYGLLSWRSKPRIDCGRLLATKEKRMPLRKIMPHHKGTPRPPAGKTARRRATRIARRRRAWTFVIVCGVSAAAIIGLGSQFVLSQSARPASQSPVLMGPGSGEEGSAPDIWVPAIDLVRAQERAGRPTETMPLRRVPDTLSQRISFLKKRRQQIDANLRAKAEMGNPPIAPRQLEDPERMDSGAAYPDAVHPHESGIFEE